MSKTSLGFIAALILAAIGGGAWIYLTRAPSAPSEAVSAGTEFTPAQTTENSFPGDSQPTVYRISQAGSSASFEIDEVLRGEDFTAVGTTNQLAGDLLVTGNDLSTVQFGPVRVNARTLKTDNTQRDGAIARAILRSEVPANEFITFNVTSVQPGSSIAGEAETPIDITGDLTIAGVTKPTTFSGTLQKLTPTEITGHAEATVRRQDFNLVIPNVPFVANVSDDVLLTADFTAHQAQ